MDELKSLRVPQSHVDFANEVAKIAEKFNLDRFTLTYRPKWSNSEEDSIWTSNISGDAVIHYTDNDGRGRPCRNLRIDFLNRCSHVIIENDESSN